jgi:hypothetical protein
MLRQRVAGVVAGGQQQAVKTIAHREELASLDVRR